jgi:hypothetical protein
VAVIDTPSETTLRWKVDGVPAQETIEGPFSDAGGLQFHCPDGTSRSVPAPDKTFPGGSDASRQQIKALRAQACR